MAKRINVKLIMELSAGGLTQNEIANSRHFSKTSVSLVLKTAKKLICNDRCQEPNLQIVPLKPVFVTEGILKEL